MGTRTRRHVGIPMEGSQDFIRKSESPPCRQNRDKDGAPGYLDYFDVWVARRDKGTAAIRARGPRIIAAIGGQVRPWPRITAADTTTDITP